MNIVKIANYIFSFYFLNVAFKNNYPETYNNIIMKISYNAIYYFSKIQMVTIKINKFVVNKYNSIITNYPFIAKTINTIYDYFIITQDVEYIKNDQVINTTSKKWLLQNYKKDEETNFVNFNFTIYTNGVNKKIFKYTPSTQIEFLCEETTYKFILIEIEINNIKKVLDFKSKYAYNYMIVDNIINKEFVIYFLKTHYSDYVNLVMQDDGELNKYNITILDQNVGRISLNEYNYLILGRSAYKINPVRDVSY